MSSASVERILWIPPLLRLRLATIKCYFNEQTSEPTLVSSCDEASLDLIDFLAASIHARLPMLSKYTISQEIKFCDKWWLRKKLQNHLSGGSRKSFSSLKRDTCCRNNLVAVEVVVIVCSVSCRTCERLKNVFRNLNFDSRPVLDKIDKIDKICSVLLCIFCSWGRFGELKIEFWT